MTSQVDSVIPLTHQKNWEDKELGKMGLCFTNGIRIDSINS
jgi:hypothetical protein